MPDEIMIVSGVLSPPHENKRTVFYMGKPIEFRDIPSKLEKVENARNYYYGVHKIRLTDERIGVFGRGYSYDDFVNGDTDGGWNNWHELAQIPFNSSGDFSKDILLGLLEKLV